MTTASFVEALEAADRPITHLLEPTGQTPLVRLYGSPAVHRLLPTPVALRVAALRGILEWYLLRGRRAHAISATAALHGLPASLAETARRARRRVVEDAVRAELEWRPWLWRELEFDGLEHLEAARTLRDGRLIVATLHLGPYVGAIHGLAAQGLKLYVCQSAEYATAAALHGRRGRWSVQQMRWVEEAGCRIIPNRGSYRLFKALLNRGEACFFALDSPGRARLRLAGHAVRVQVGVASLALETSAPILPVLVVRQGWRQRGVLFAPIDPVGFPDPAALTQRMFDVLGPTFAKEQEQADLNFLRLRELADRAARNRR